MELTFFVAKASHCARKFPCLSCWLYAVLIGQAGHKKYDCQILSRQGGTLLQNILLKRKVCWLFEIYRPKIDASTLQRNFGWQSRHPIVSVINHIFRSCLLALLAYLVNIISFLGLWGNWRLDGYSYSFPCLPDAKSKLW